MSAEFLYVDPNQRQRARRMLNVLKASQLEVLRGWRVECSTHCLSYPPHLNTDTITPNDMLGADMQCIGAYRLLENAAMASGQKLNGQFVVLGLDVCSSYSALAYKICAPKIWSALRQVGKSIPDGCSFIVHAQNSAHAWLDILKYVSGMYDFLVLQEVDSRLLSTRSIMVHRDRSSLGVFDLPPLMPPGLLAAVSL